MPRATSVESLVGRRLLFAESSIARCYSRRWVAASCRRRRRSIKLRFMHTLARLLQLVGLTIPPLAMVAQLNGDIGPGPMLQFLAIAVGVFLLGYGLQRYAGPRQ